MGNVAWEWEEEWRGGEDEPCSQAHFAGSTGACPGWRPPLWPAGGRGRMLRGLLILPSPLREGRSTRKAFFLKMH